MLNKSPGLLGYGGIIAIHANWPIYPPGIGWQVALRTLGNFPKGMKFYEVDDIDRCKLLINENPEHLIDPFDSKYFHLAVWHEDLVDLRRRGFVGGLEEKSDYEFEMFQFNNLRSKLGTSLKEEDEGNLIFFLKDNEGQLRETKYQKPICDEDDLYSKDCAVIPKTISLTQSGIHELVKLSRDIVLSEQLGRLTQLFIDIGRYDTAIREGSLLVETSIKEFHNRPNLYGQRLVEYHLEQIVVNNDGLNSAAIKSYRGELRTIFKFIRNDFAHNFRILSKEQCMVMLSRINDVLSEFSQVKDAYFNQEST